MKQKRPHDRTAESRLKRIERRAYEIYQARGGTGDRELGDWLQAERDIDAASTAVPGSSDVIRDM